MGGPKNMAELVKSLRGDGEGDGEKELKPEDVMSPEAFANLKFEKVVFQIANTEKHRGGCYTSDYLNSIRERVKKMIEEGKIKI
jgi:hypothetical protein